MKADLKYTIDSLASQNFQKISRLLEYHKSLITKYDRLLRQSQNYIASNAQKVDELGFRLRASLPNFIVKKRMNLQYFPISRFIPQKTLQLSNIKLNNIFENLKTSSATLLQVYKHKLTLNNSLLSSLDYNKVLKRGYAMVKNYDGKYISSVSKINQSEKIIIKLHDGEIAPVKS